MMLSERIAALRQTSWEWFVLHAQRPHALGWLALVAFTDAVFSPLPPEVFLVALTLARPARARVYLVVATLFSMLGAVAGYFVAGFLFHQFGEPLLAFYHLESAFVTSKHLIMGHVFWAMMIASFTPIPDKVFIYAGGFLGVHLAPFIPGYFVGRPVRMALVVYLTGRYGERVLEVVRRYLLLFGLLLLALLVLYGIVHLHLFGL